ncbi:DDE-type integrase/transposase/recombinase [Corynebacterium pacaense]|uniref:DDE-type integrase/transposase/recombinase n=1 Tax=Corynebacterium pacaense TaxID=1816684 RepID=UPI003CCC3C42
MYAAFVLDAYSREIVGWQVTNHMRASLARDALDMALSARLFAGEDFSEGDPSQRPGSARLIQLVESKVVASVGSRVTPTTTRWPKRWIRCSRPS